MKEYEKDSASGMGMFGCFNMDEPVGARKTNEKGGYASAGVRISGSGSWVVSTLLGLSVIGVVVGGV